MPSKNKEPHRCKDGSLDMRCKENFGKSKYGDQNEKKIA
jgi:hypothetical protein